LSFRRKLSLVFALTVFLSVGAVTWIVSSVTRRAFEHANEDQTAALIAQFRREFNRRGEDVAHRVETIASDEAVTRMALAVNRGPADYSAYVNEAKALADNQQLDFLEFVDSHGTILSSAQWPAKFGYKESSLPSGSQPKVAFLRQEELPDGAALSLSAIRQVPVGDNPLCQGRPDLSEVLDFLHPGDIQVHGTDRLGRTLSRSIPGSFLDGEFDLNRLAVPYEIQPVLAADCGGRHQIAKMPAVHDITSVESFDDVASSESGLFRRSLGLQVCDNRALHIW